MTVYPWNTNATMLLGMDAKVTVSSWKKVIMLWPWICMDALVTVYPFNANVIMLLGMDALVNVCPWNSNAIVLLGTASP